MCERAASRRRLPHADVKPLPCVPHALVVRRLHGRAVHVLTRVLVPPAAVTLHDLRAAAFAPSMLAAGSSRHSLCRSTGPALLAAGVLRCEGDMTAACSGQSQRRGRMLLLSAAASKVFA